MILSRLNNLQQRLIVSAVAVTALIFIIGLSHHPLFRWLFLLMAVSGISAAVWEYYRIAQAKNCQPLFKIGILATIAYICAIFLRTQFDFAGYLPQIVVYVTFLCAFLYYFARDIDPFINLAVTVFGIVYLAIPLSCLVEINYMEKQPLVVDGRWCLLYLLLVTKMTDTGAFFIGKLFGRHKMSPFISPKKTWEGAFGGLCIALLTSLLLYALFHYGFSKPPFDLSLWQSVWLGGAISIIGQVGDLAESLLKRSGGVKDSSQLPGLGGMLDIVDSLVFTSPLMYLFLKLEYI